MGKNDQREKKREITIEELQVIKQFGGLKGKRENFGLDSNQSSRKGIKKFTLVINKLAGFWSCVNLFKREIGSFPVFQSNFLNIIIYLWNLLNVQHSNVMKSRKLCEHTFHKLTYLASQIFLGMHTQRLVDINMNFIEHIIIVIIILFA